MFLRTTAINGDLSVSDIVRSDYRTADVFQKYGIEYCCGGKFPLNTICEMKGVDMIALYEELDIITRDIHVSGLAEFSEWTIDFLTEYIVNIHHHYLRKALPQLQEHISRFADGHRKKFEYLDEVQRIIDQLPVLDRKSVV